MKKLLFIGICCLCLCGCEKDLNEYQFSELISEKRDDSGAYYISGSIKNISNTSCIRLSITIEITSGSLVENKHIYINNPSKGSTLKFKELILTDLDNFSSKVKKVECFNN